MNIGKMHTMPYNAVVLFTSDHGVCLGQHGLVQKWAMYDCITRVPLIAWSPRRFGGGCRVDGLCQLFDLGPTNLELAEVPVPELFEARSLLPALEGKSWIARSHVFCEQAGDTNLTGADKVTMVRTERWKLVHYKGKPYGQLFDLDQDPDEVRDLWHEPAHAPTRQRLLDDLREWLIESNYSTREYMSALR